MPEIQEAAHFGLESLFGLAVGDRQARTVEVGEALAGHPAGEAPVVAVELGAGEDRICPYCGAQDAVANGKSRGMQRSLC
ncbi:MAG: hypothetical protein GDA36_05420 [Rhodobacteraceae bacterium]|nr:hypothetical protein [Paracoccaceae bacterium]